MTSPLLWKEHLERFCNRYSYGIRPVVRFLFAFCTVVSLNTNIGYMAKLKSPSVILPVCLVSTFLPYDAIVLLAGYLMITHVYAVSLEMTLIAIVLILTVAILYYGFRPGDSCLMILTPLAFLLKVPYMVPLLIGLEGSLVSVIPVGRGVFLYYLLIYMKQNAGILTASDGSVDIVQKYNQILKSMLFNQTMMVVITTHVVGVIAVYLIYRLSMDYAWVIAIVAGSMTELLVIFMGDFAFGVSVSVGPMILGLVLSAAVVAVFNFFVLSVDYTRTEYAQFEDDDYYYYVRAVPRMTVSTPDAKVQKINIHKRGTGGRNSYQ